MKSKSTILAGALLATGSSALFTGKVIVAKLAYERGIDPLGMVLLRMVFASPFFIAILLMRLRHGARAKATDIAFAVLLGLVSYYLSSMLDFCGIQYISTALERMILQLSPSFVVLIGVLFMGQKLDYRLLGAIAIGYCGIALMVLSESGPEAANAASSNTLLGVTLILAATLCFSLYVIGAERMMLRMESRFFTALAMTGACVGVFIHYAISRGFTPPTHDPVVGMLGLAMGLFCTVLPSFMINRAIQLIGGSNIGPYNYVGMGLTFVASAILLDETFTLIKLSGILLASAGALALTMGKKKETGKA